MAKINSLRDIIQFNSNFKTAINLYLSLNKAEKVLGYIPTKSSVSFLGEYLKAVLENKEQATLLVGPYGKGKSHLLLVLLAVLSMKKTPESESAINELIDNVSKTDEVGERVSEYIGQVWDKKRFLPVLITDTTGDLNQAFLYGLNDALKRDGLLDLAPETYYSIALDRIDDWEQNYFETYKMFERELTQNGMSIAELKTDLKQYSQKTLILFKEIYPKVTAGSEFNPMALADALPLYKSVSEKLVDEYGYSGIYIVFDEFSKFIEGQNNIAAGTNMHLLQSMCELATDSKNAQVFITMVAHKSIKEYGKYLSRDLINLFTGIEGRIIEKYFVTSSKNNYELIKNAIVKDDSKLLNIPHYEKYLGKEKFKEFYSLPAFRSGFDETEFKNVIFNGCYPLNPIAAYLLLNISEKVAQNERTLFTFISNDEPHSMARFVSEHTLDKEWSIGADLIYEYFSALFKKDVVNEFIHNIWLSAEYAIDKCDTEDQRKIVKALAVILIVNKEDEIPATEKYLKLCINASDPEQALMELKKKEFIYKKNSTDSYVFKTRAGSELKAEIKRQRELKGENVNYSKVLLDVTGNYFIIPRKYNTVKMMTRYFTNEFMSVDDFLNITSSTALLDNTLDGKVITLYSFSRIKQEAVKQHLLELAEKRLVVICPKKGLKAKKQLKDYEIISDLKGNQVFTNNNEILKRELPLLLDDLTTELEIIIGDVYEDDLDTKVLYFDGGRIKNAKSGNVEKAVNECCLNVYTSTPIINNEMVNRAEIGTAQTKKARLNIVQAILSHTDTPEFYRGSNQEATIYRSLFCVTGIVDGDIREDIQLVIDEINRYIDSCCDKKVSVKGMVYKLVKAPYGMRAGVIPFYLAYVLANRREDIIVYFSNKEVQITSDIVVNMCEQPEDYAVYVSKEDLQKEKYISELNMLFEVDDNWNLSSNRIKDIIICMQRWFRSLQQATRNVIYLDQYVDNDNMVQAMKTMKKAMQKVEFNPFEILFVEFPEAFGTESLEETFNVIDDCKTRYDDYFRWIEEQAIKAIYDLWDKKRKQNLYHTLKEWYDKQGKRSKMGLYDGRMTNFMSCLEGMDVYSDQDVASKVVKAVTDVYMENWNTGSLEEFVEALTSVKNEVVSNVTGYVLPIEEIFGESKKQGSINILDSAQSMGLIDIRADLIKVDIIAFAGHKTLYGPFGIGGFINVSGIKLNTFITGGTGSDSLNLDMPSGNESKYESASANIVAIAGLNAALESLDQRKCYEHEKELTKYLIERLSNNKKVKMYLPNDLENHIGIVSLTVDGFSSEDIGIILDEDFDIAVRTGYHCAPYIHKYLKDETQLGTVRVGIGQFNTKKEIDLFVKAIEEIVYE